jgi:hypothetical protein
MPYTIPTTFLTLRADMACPRSRASRSTVGIPFAGGALIFNLSFTCARARVLPLLAGMPSPEYSPSPQSQTTSSPQTTYNYAAAATDHNGFVTTRLVLAQRF